MDATTLDRLHTWNGWSWRLVVLEVEWNLALVESVQQILFLSSHHCRVERYETLRITPNAEELGNSLKRVAGFALPTYITDFKKRIRKAWVEAMWKQNKTRKQIRNAEPKKVVSEVPEEFEFEMKSERNGYPRRPGVSSKTPKKYWAGKKRVNIPLQSLKSSLFSIVKTRGNGHSFTTHPTLDIVNHRPCVYPTPKQNASQFVFTSTSMRVVYIAHEWHENLSWRWSSFLQGTNRARSRKRRERFRNKSWQAELVK